MLKYWFYDIRCSSTFCVTAQSIDEADQLAKETAGHHSYYLVGACSI